MNFIGEFFGYMAGILTAICFLPQTIKTLRTRDVKGLSLVSYFIYTVGILCWVIYGFFIRSIPMILFNGISVIFAGSIFLTILKEGKNEKN
ncbi:MAG: SemiSWEET transporter [Pseudomonadota bacterium]|nr:SemiSWEET transporter [Pseudomonadota bacterium]